MKIFSEMRKDSDGNSPATIIREVYSGAYISTAEGNEIGFCMRDDTIEFNVLPHAGGSKWYRVNMQTLAVEAL